jgi:transposase-like protein
MAEKQGSELPDIQRWSAKRKASLVLDVLKGKTTIAEACRLYDLTPSEVESWVDEGQRGLENALRARPQDVREEYESKVKDLQAKVGELVLERDALKKLSALLDSTEKR